MRRVFIVVLMFWVGVGQVWAQSQPLEINPANGSAGYNYSVDVPAGRAGVQPGLGVGYNSASGNGVVGVGWSLELGHIQVDVSKGVPKYDGTDNYVLAQGGQVDLVKDGTIYRAKIEGSFSKTEKIGVYWVMTNRKGTKYFYGQTSASRQESGSKIFRWYLDKVQDVHGNYMTYTYQKDGGQVYPLQIDYTGFAGTPALAPYAQVKFVLEPRTDTTTSYKSAFLVETKKRVREISTWAQGSKQSAYVISYKYGQTGRSLIDSITAVGSDGTSTLPPVTFVYRQQVKGFQLTPATMPIQTAFTEQQSGRWADLGVRIADVNSDGYADLLQHYQNCSGSIQKNIYLNNKQNGWGLSNNWDFPAGLFPFVKNCSDLDRDRGVRFADMNSDGRIDIVWNYQDKQGTVHRATYLNKGNSENTVYGWGADEYWRMPATTEFIRDTDSPVAEYPNNMGVSLIDVNADGYDDVLIAKESPGTRHDFYRNNLVNAGGSWPVEDPYRTFDGVYTDSTKGMAFVDLNGDGLIDVFNKYNNVVTIFMNTGTGWYKDTASPYAEDLGYAKIEEGETQFFDINGDGLADLVTGKSAQASGSKTLLNTGKGWLVDDDWILPEAVFATGSSRMLEANGDKLPDLMIHIKNVAQKLYLNKGVVPDVLTEIRNGIGGMTTLSYVSSKTTAQTFLPFPMEVVSNVTVSDSRGGNYVTQYKYEKGLWAADAREFRGFGVVTKADPDGNYVVSRYGQGALDQGRLLESIAYDAAGNKHHQITSTWAVKSISSGVDFVYLKRQLTGYWDGAGSVVWTAEDYFYDEPVQYGNLTKTVQYGKVDANGTDLTTADNRTVEVVYNNNPSIWLLGAPRIQQTLNGAGQVQRKTTMYYDNLGLTAAPARGLKTKQQDWGGTGTADPVNTYTYDQFGNMITAVNPLLGKIEITYDSENYLFPVVTKNPKGHLETMEYYGVAVVPLDSGDGYKGMWGQVKSTTDRNNKKQLKSYDVFGRMTAIVSPLDTISKPTTSIIYGFGSTYSSITTKSRIVSGGAATSDVAQIMDGLGREVQIKRKAEGGKYIVSGQTKYNLRGEPVEKYDPFFTTTGLTVVDSIVTSRPHTKLTYDPMGRVIKEQHADGTYNTTQYAGVLTIKIDENGHRQDSLFDTYGRLVRKDEYTGADGRHTQYSQQSYAVYASTHYEYSSEGDLVKLTDAYGNLTQITYDNLGRKKSLIDPNVGTWTYVYDKSGNLTQQTDGNGQITTWTYDNMSRVISRSGEAYTYDNATNANGLGRLAKAVYPGGQAEWKYDELGRELEFVKTVNAVPFQVQRDYDDLDRVTRVQYPDQSGVEFTYNDAGQVETVSSPAFGADIRQDPACVGAWAFDETTGAAVDKCTADGAQNGTVSSGVVRTGSSYQFTSQTNVNFGDVTFLDRKSAATFCAEVKLNPGDLGTTTVSLFRKDGAWTPMQSYLSKWRALLWTTAKITHSGLDAWVSADSQWHTYCYVYTGTQRTAYRDGVMFGTALSDTGVFANSSAPFYIGGNGTLESFKGEVKNVLIMSRALTSGEMSNLYGGGQAQQYVTNVDYNAAGQMTKIVYGNGVVTDYTYNSMFRLSRMKTYNGVVLLQDFEYFYDGVGNITEIKDWVHAASQTFKYDELNRLLEAHGEVYGDKYYAYDKIGNIIFKDGKSFYYGEGGAGSQAITSTSDGTYYQYDAAGNMTTKSEAGHTWEYFYTAGRMTSVKKDGVLVADYKYDSDGGRTQKTVYSTGETTRYVGGLYEQSGSRTTKHIYMSGMRIASVTNGQLIYLHGDHLGSANVITDTAGVEQEVIEYDPWGLKLKHTRPQSSPQTAWHYFNGKLFDDETELYYYGARYYDPKIGRFLTPDSKVPDFSNPQALNRYSYALNNPVNRVDPTGHWSFAKFFKAFVAAFVGAVLTVVTLGAGAPLAIALMAGGAANGFIGGGWTDGGWSWKGALIGAGVGGLTGFAMGGGLGPVGVAVAWGAVLGGMGYTIATEGTDGLSTVLGGLAGGLVGGVVGFKLSQKFDPNSIFKVETVKAQDPQVQQTKTNTQLETEPGPVIVSEPSPRAPPRPVESDGIVVGYIIDGEFHVHSTASRAQMVARIHGGNAKQFGHSWTPESPWQPGFAQRMGIPVDGTHNTAANVSVGVLRKGAHYIDKTASPHPFTKAAAYGREFGVIHPEQDITIIFEGPYKP